MLIIGSGAAGMTTALHLAGDYSIAMIGKDAVSEGSTYYAQGGVAAVLDDDDTVDSHIADTLDAGAGLCHEDVVRFTVERSSGIIDWLVDLGVEFDMRHNSRATRNFISPRKVGHSHRRVLHAADATGREIANKLVSNVVKRDNIEIFERFVAVDLITQDKIGRAGNGCVGAYVLNLETGEVSYSELDMWCSLPAAPARYICTPATQILPLGRWHRYGLRAGCRVANMEFNQFHPTCLYHPDARSFLVTEALRGEGALLKLPDGQRFMPKFDERAELAPRDIVARAIDHEMKRLGCDCIYLDNRATRIQSLFRAISQPFMSAVWVLASTSQRIQYPSFQPPITPAAGLSPIPTAKLIFRICTPLVNRASPAYTARTAWPATRS